MVDTSIDHWLRSIGLAKYAEIFEQNAIGLDVVASLSEQDLKDLGIALGDRKRLQSAIAKFGDNAPRSPSAPVSPVPMDGERRQLTVMFCDLVGFTELASRLDPEVLQGIVRRYEDTCAACVTRYEGYVFQRLGDGIVAFFGYPLAHEGEAERAIRAALEIIEALSSLEVAAAGRLQVRIGIATGLVVVSSAEKGAVGETMNLAARLQAISQPGVVVVSEAVRRLAAGAFRYQSLGEQTLKGFAQPVQAYCILGMSEAASRFDAASGDALTPLVGRELELGLLLERWHLAQDGEGQVVLLSGEPGIGKSRILTALRARLESQGAKTLRFQCSPYHVNSALWPSIDHLERLLKFARDESAQSRLDRLEALLLTGLGLPRSDVRFMAAMLSLPCEARYGPLNITPQKHKDETLRTLVDLIEAGARKQPTLMLFEDAHWADPTTLDAMDLLVDRVTKVPLLMVLTHRPEFQSRWSRHGHVTALNLSKLSRAQSAAMIVQLAGKALPSELTAQILEKTDGVPLFVEELTKSILESGDLKDVGDRYEYASANRHITLPATLRDSLMARLDRNLAAKEVAQIGAVIGREFSYELIAAVAPKSERELDAALAQLTDSGLAFRRGTPPEALYSFKHALVQDAAYDSLLKSRRQELHANIARAMEEHFSSLKETEPEVLARHLTAAGNAEAAIPLWKSAGELALRRMTLQEAISHLNKGLELVATLPASRDRDTHELDMRTTLGTAWLALKGWAAPEIWSSYHPAISLAKALKRNDALVPILRGLWVQEQCIGHVAQSRRWVEEIFNSARDTGDSDLLILGHGAACSQHFWSGRCARALEHANKVRELYDPVQHRHLADLTNHDPKTDVDCLSSLATWMHGYPDQAVHLSEEAVANARRYAHPFDMGYALAMGAEVFDFRCEPERLRERALECEQLGRESSLPVLWALLAPVAHGVALIRDGNITEGIAQLTPALAMWDASGGKIRLPYMKSVIAQGMAMNDDVDSALHLIDEQIEQIERPGWEEKSHYAEILRLKGWMLTLNGDAVAAERNFLASLDCAREQQAKSWELRTATSLARLWRSQGKFKHAYDLLAPVYDWFTEGFDTHDLKEAKALLQVLGSSR